MKVTLAILGALAMWFGTSLLAQEPETIDRVIATVNRQPLLLSEWETSLRIEAFLQGRELGTFTEAERKAALNRLIDRQLLIQQMQADYSPNDSDVTERTRAIRKQFKGAESDEGWTSLLETHGLTSGDITAFIRSQLQVMRFVDLRLRPTIHIDEETIEAYYRESLVPAVTKSGETPEGLPQLRSKIREILVQEKMDSVLESWLANLRSQTEVHIASDPDTPTGRLLPGGGVEQKPKPSTPE